MQPELTDQISGIYFGPLLLSGQIWDILRGELGCLTILHLLLAKMSLSTFFGIFYIIIILLTLIITVVCLHCNGLCCSTFGNKLQLPITSFSDLPPMQLNVQQRLLGPSLPPNCQHNPVMFSEQFLKIGRELEIKQSVSVSIAWNIVWRSLINKLIKVGQIFKKIVQQYLHSPEFDSCCYFLLYIYLFLFWGFFRASVHGVRCPPRGLWPRVTSQLDWISLRLGRGRANDPVGCPDSSLQVMRQRLCRLPQGSNTTEATLGKTLTSFPTVGKLYCDCWQGNICVRTIPLEAYTKMTM